MVDIETTEPSGPTTTVAVFVERLDLYVPGTPRAVLRDGPAELHQCRGCSAFLPEWAFRPLANAKSLCGLTSECRRCEDLRKGRTRVAQQTATVQEALAS